jgi:hypothetical protein
MLKESVPPFIEIEALNMARESLKSLLKKLAYLQAKSFKL